MPPRSKRTKAREERFLAALHDGEHMQARDEGVAKMSNIATTRPPLIVKGFKSCATPWRGWPTIVTQTRCHMGAYRGYLPSFPGEKKRPGAEPRAVD